MPALSQTRYDEQRAHILGAARQVFARKGFHQTSIKDIMEEAKVSNGAIFTYFKTKDEMILEIIRENLGQIIQRINEIVASSDHIDLEETLLALLEMVRQISLGPGRAMSMHVWSLSMVNPDVENHTREHCHQIHRSLEDLVKRFQKAGALSMDLNPKRTAKALFSMLLPGYILQLLLVERIEPLAYLKAYKGLCQPAK